MGVLNILSTGSSIAATSLSLLASILDLFSLS